MNSFLRAIWNAVFNTIGLDISFGTSYRDWSFYLLEFRADYEQTKNLLAERHFTPKDVAPGETRLQIVSCDMRDVLIVGSYHEVSIQVPVEPLDDSSNETFAHLYLPVTTEAARWPGVDISGFPKFIAQIDIARDNGQAVCRLALDGELIVEFRIEDHTGTEKQVTWEYYGIRKQHTIRTTFDLKGLFFEGESRQHAGLVLGKHAISETLGSLLLSEEPVRIIIGHDVSGFLRRPVRVDRDA
jgi:hypothetical protein